MRTQHDILTINKVPIEYKKLHRIIQIILKTNIKLESEKEELLKLLEIEKYNKLPLKPEERFIVMCSNCDTCNLAIVCNIEGRITKKFRYNFIFNFKNNKHLVYNKNINGNNIIKEYVQYLKYWIHKQKEKYNENAKKS